MADLTTVTVIDNFLAAATAAAANTVLGLGTGSSPQFTAVNIGAATDTTVARSAAGKITVEAKAVPLMDGTVDLTIAGPTVARTMTLPDANFTAARTDAANTFTGTQTVGALVATTVNGNTITTGTGVLTIAASKTLTASNTLTLAGTDGTTMTFPSTTATIARTDAANTFTGVQTMTSPSFTTSVVTGSTTLAVFNTTATTVNAFGAATTLNIGASATCILNFGGSTTASEFRFLEPSGSGTNYTAFKAKAQSASITYTLPDTVGAAGTYLRDVAGDGVLSWAAASGSGDVATDAIWDAAGDIVVGTGANTAARLAKGTALQILRVNSGATALEWVDPGAASVDEAADYTWTGSHNFSAATVTLPTITTLTVTTATVTALEPATNDGAALGSTTKQFSDLFLAEGGVINWDNGDATMTQTSNDITFAGISTFTLGSATALTAGTGTFAATTSLLLGTAGSAVGNIGFRNATSGTATLAPPTGALGTYSVTLPNAASTLPIFGQQITFAGPTQARTVTLPDAAFTVARTDAANTFTGASTTTSWPMTTQVVTGGLTASGSGSNNFSGSSGAFLTSTGAVTIGPGAVALTGVMTLAENVSIALDPAGSADGKYSGITVAGTGGATIAFGDLITLDKDDSRWELVDISVAAAATGDARGLLGMAVTSSTDGTAVTVLLQGIIRADANFPTLTIGAEVFASTTGDITSTQPTTTDHVIRRIGAALTADEIYFSPSYSWYTHT